MYRLYFIISILLCFSKLSFSQQEDFNTWYNFTFDGKLFKKLDFAFEPQLRLFENSSQLESWLMEMNVSTKIKKWCDIGMAYRYQVGYDDPKHNDRKHRWAVFSKFDYKTGKLKWNYRFQLQTEQENINSSKNGSIVYIEHRHKLDVNYKNKKWPIEPSVGIEYYFSIAPEKDKGEWKNRYFISLEKEISKRISCKLSYKRQQEFNVNNPDILNIINIGISYSPKWLKIKKLKS